MFCPHTLGASKHVCQKFMRSKLPISKNKENISEQTSGKYALLYTKNDVEIV